ncbi:Gfo/Idh/MocA family oxidoreductase [Niabella sp. 3A5MI-3]|nr:Gfo/Idh/MocA family oxidoreductase [Niabella beijingensis]
MPQRQYTIFMIGAGGIVEAAHLPAYRKAGWEVGGIYDLQADRARLLAEMFSIPAVFETLPALVTAAGAGVVFDVAVPATELPGVIRQLPDGATVLMQKPMGTTIAEAQLIRDLCREKKLLAAVNFQMKFIPAMIAARNLIASGAIGTLHDMEIRMNIYHPWHLWKFLYGIPRMEMLYHSIHYVDMLKSFFGLPQKVYARTLKHPLMKELASTRSVILLDYGDLIKAHINTNHGHDFGLKHQESFVKFEGTAGAIKTTLGLNIDYPNGVPDSFEYVIREEGKDPEWKSVTFPGQWFPDAFIASMAELLCYAEGSSDKLMNHFENAYQTMAIVEAAYQSNETGGTTVAYQQ